MHSLHQDTGLRIHCQPHDNAVSGSPNLSPPLVNAARFYKTTFIYTQTHTYIPEPQVLVITSSQLS